MPGGPPEAKPAAAQTLSAAVAQVAGISPFFALADRVDPDGRPMAELVDDPAALRRRIDATREALAASTRQPHGAIEMRVAGSLAHLNLVARLVSPAVGLAVVAGLVPSYDLNSLHWQPVLGGAFPLSVAGLRAHPEATPAAQAARIDRDVLAPVVWPITEAVAAMVPVSRKVLHGNVMSALAAAATLAGGAGPDRARPARDLLGEFRNLPALRGTATEDGGFRRRSCCLFYRVAPGAGICADCVLSR